ncbi:MAG: hypothetical protein WC100_00830 [Sterolibacterium sp.]
MGLRWTHFPYCLQRLKDGRYIILNRRYKPIGNQGTNWVDYETDPTVVKIRMTKATAKKLSWKGSEDVEVIHLYNDGCIPTNGAAHMTAYCKRLAILMALKIKTP